MKRLVGSLSLALGIVVTASSCNGANEVTGLTRGDSFQPSTPTPVATPQPRPTPDPCRQTKTPCELVLR